MNKKTVGIVVLVLALVVGIFAGVTILTQKEQSANNISATNSDSKASIKKAESLIGKSVSQDDVKSIVGNWKDFEMSNKGCERGVYAGRFYYDKFIIFSKTYDKGETFHVESINER